MMKQNKKILMYSLYLCIFAIVIGVLHVIHWYDDVIVILYVVIISLFTFAQGGSSGMFSAGAFGVQSRNIYQKEMESKAAKMVQNKNSSVERVQRDYVAIFIILGAPILWLVCNMCFHIL